MGAHGWTAMPHVPDLHRLPIRCHFYGRFLPERSFAEHFGLKQELQAGGERWRFWIWGYAQKASKCETLELTMSNEADDRRIGD